MNRSRRAIGNGIGAAIGAVLGAVVFDFLLAFEPGGIHVDVAAGFPFVMIGAAVGTIIGGTVIRGAIWKESGAVRRRFFLTMALTIALVVVFSLAITIIQEFFS